MSKIFMIVALSRFQEKIKLPGAVIVLGIFLILCPILVSNLFLDHYRPLKVGSFLIIVPICSAFLLLHRRPSSFTFNHLDLILIFLSFWMGLSLIWSLNPISAFETFCIWMTGVLLYFSIRAYQPSILEVRYFQACILLSYILNVIYGLLQVYGIEPFELYYFKKFNQLPVAFLGHANYAAQYILIGLALLIGNLFLSKKLSTKLGYLILLIPGILFFYFLKSKASWLGFAVVIFFYSLVLFQSKIKSDSPIKNWVMIFLILLVIGGIYGVVFQTHPKIGSPSSIRLARYLNTLTMIADKPLLGVGLENYQEYYPLYYNNVLKDQEMRPTLMVLEPHSDYLRFFAETGVIGGAMMILLAFLILRYQTQGRFEWLIIKITLIGILVNSLFSFPLKHPQILVVFFLGIGILSNQLIDGKTFFVWTRIRKWSASVFFVIVMVLPLMGIKHLVSRHLIREAKAYRFIGENQIAEKAYQWTILLSPSYSEAYFDLIVYYRDSHRNEEALELLNKILVLHPNHWNFLYLKSDILKKLGFLQLSKNFKERADAITQGMSSTNSFPEKLPVEKGK